MSCTDAALVHMEWMWLLKQTSLVVYPLAHGRIKEFPDSFLHRSCADGDRRAGSPGAAPRRSEVAKLTTPRAQVLRVER